MRKLISIFISLLIAFSTVSVNAFADSDKSYITMKNGYYYLVSSFSDEENIVFQLGRKGPNKLFEIIKVSFANTGISYENAINNGWTLYESYTDHFGPYGIVAENGDENFTGTFTGGNHGYENSGDTSIGTKNTATGRCISLNVYADGVLITEGNGRYANNVTFDWVNGIQAANTKRPDGSGREVLTEHYRMVFDGKQFNIQNDITALENITITPYYGNQAIVGWATDGIKYVGNADNKWYPANTQHNSGNQTCSSYIAKKGPYHMQTSYDPTYGLGKGEHFGSSPSVMIEAYGKGYFSFFRDGCYAPKGSTFSYRGSYRYYYSDGSEEPEKVPVNYALDKTYTVSAPTSADGSYMDSIRMDTDNKELTNGVDPYSDYWNEYGWAHWIGTAPEIVVDLEKTESFDTFEITALSHFSADGFILPANVKISVSNDNVNFSEVNTVNFPDSTEVTSPASYHLLYKHTQNVSGRYVKFTFPEGWNIIGELRVIGVPEEIYENIALNKKYSASASPTLAGDYMDSIRMDTDDMELTNGVIPSADYWHEYGWVHWIGKPVDIVVDLEKIEAFNTLEVTALSHFSADGFIMPSDVTIFISKDNVNWSEVSKVEFPDSETVTTPTSYTLSYSHNEALSARYVKFSFPDGWNLIGEIKVIKTDNSVPSVTYYTVSGNVKAFGSKTDDATVEFLKDGNVLKTTSVKDAYAFGDVEEGKYVIRVSKSKHASREYATEVASDTVQDVEIRLYGDVNGDGIINNTDVLQMNRKTANLVSVFDITDELEYKMKVANITAVSGNDNIINNMDVLQMNRKIANLASAFDNIK